MTTRPSCDSPGGRTDIPKNSNNNSNRNRNRNRRHGCPNLQRATELPGAFPHIPPSLSYNNEKRGNRNHTNCINDALAVLRSIKRRKRYGKKEEEQQQQQQQQLPEDSRQPQTSSNDVADDKSRPIHLNETNNSNTNITNKSNLVPSTATVLPLRPTRTNGYRQCTIGILPPAPSKNKLHQHQQ